MGKKVGGKQEVNEYRLSMHLGIAVECDTLNAIYIGEKVAFEGAAAGGAVIAINKHELFGGVKKEGGVAGLAYFLSGAANQVLPPELAGRFNRTSLTCPGFRGFASLFLIGQPGHGVASAGTIIPAVVGNKGATRGTNLPGFLCGANTPYLKTIWAKVTRSPKVAGLDQRWRMLGAIANPAHIIYECLTNDDWGMGEPDTGIDIAALNKASQTLFNEKLGMAMLWTRQAPIESFINEVLDHIQALLFLNPRTGLMTLKLTRNDYDASTLRTINRDNADLSNFQRKGLGETVNEIVVTWTNPENEKEETISRQDIGNIAQQGGIVSDNRNYYAFRDPETAVTVCLRDLRQSAAPLISCDVELDRQAWDILPGDVVKLNWPEHAVDQIIMRVLNVDYGKPGEPLIKASLVEDIFGLESAQFSAPRGSLWVDTKENPTPLTYARIFTAPGYFLGIDITQLTYPEAAVGIIGATSSRDTTGFNILAETTQANGSSSFTLGGSKMLNGHGTLGLALNSEALSTGVIFTNRVGEPGPDISGFVMIGSGSDDACEIALLRQKTLGGEWTLDRGVIDTIPRAWSLGTEVWFIDPEDGPIIEEARRAEGETARFKLLPRTSLGLLPEAATAIVSTVVSARPHLPNRPANVTVNGQAFQASDTAIDGSALASVPITWANRNRTLEDSQILRWSDGTIPPEPGQTTSVIVMSLDRTIIVAYRGLLGTTYDLSLAELNGVGTIIVRVESERDGLESLQAAEFRIRIASGYGLGYGYNYGGA